MKRREFLNVSLPAVGTILVGQSVLGYGFTSEINRQFSGDPSFSSYDLIINGAGLSGYFAAVHAAKLGKKVLLVEKRSSPGFEITAKKKLWLGKSGFEKWNAEVANLFFNPEELIEVHTTSGTGKHKSEFGDELLLFSGSVRKTMLRNLLVNEVHVLLMTDVCGLVSDGSVVKGVLVAGKHGLHTIECHNFIDASDNAFFSRSLSGQNYSIEKAGFTLELLNVERPARRSVKIDEKYQIADNLLKFHPGKHVDKQLFIEFEFKVSSQKTHEIELQARKIAAMLGSNFERIDSALSKATIEQFALECTLHLNNDSLPKTVLQGHHILQNNASGGLDCNNIVDIEEKAGDLVRTLKYNSAKGKNSTLQISGASIPYNDLIFEDVDEPGLSIPLKRCRFDYEKHIIHKDQCQVLIAGGGTSGAMAGMGAVEKGADTIVVEYFNDMGGTKTMGGVMGYYHGVKDNKFFKKQEEDALQIAFQTNTSKKLGRILYHQNSLINKGGRHYSDSIICDAISKNDEVNGIVICRNGNLQLIKASLTIDATGDGDIAAFAGASYFHGDLRCGKTQNYSQWDIVGGAKKLPSATGRDYGIIDNTKISEIQRGLFISHYEAHYYDFHPLLSVRESRRIEANYVMDLIDCVEGTHFQDMISLASSDYDPHYTGSSAYTRSGFLLPHSNILTVEIPYRCLVPKTLKRILISGKAFSQTNTALQFTRMSGDLAVLGYLTGQIAGEIVWKGSSTHEFDISNLQKEWLGLGYITQPYYEKAPGNLVQNQKEILRRVDNLAQGKREYLYECIRLSKDHTVPVLTQHFHKTTEAEGKLLIAKALAWFGQETGNELIDEELKALFNEEKSAGYPEGYVENYDFIRGREKNVLEGLFWKINQNIALLALSGNPQFNNTINHILSNTTSGGEMVDRESEYYNGRIDLRIIPFYNRILNLCFYIERIPDHSFIPGLEILLKDKNIAGYKTEDYKESRWKFYGGDLELFISAALARCGSKKGFDLLVEYLDDVNYCFKKFAHTELIQLTGSKHNYASDVWKKQVANMAFPAEIKGLESKIEV